MTFQFHRQNTHTHTHTTQSTLQSEKETAMFEAFSFFRLSYFVSGKHSDVIEDLLACLHIAAGRLREAVRYVTQYNILIPVHRIYNKGKVIPLQARCGPEGG